MVSLIPITLTVFTFEWLAGCIVVLVYYIWQWWILCWYCFVSWHAMSNNRYPSMKNSWWSSFTSSFTPSSSCSLSPGTQCPTRHILLLLFLLILMLLISFLKQILHLSMEPEILEISYNDISKSASHICTILLKD